MLLFNHRIRRMISSYVGENKEFARQYLHGELEVELTPQGTLAERMRAGGSGIPAFFTATGVGTQVAEGGLPWKYDDRRQRGTSPRRPRRSAPSRRPRARRSSCSRRRSSRTSGWCAPGRATGTATWCSAQSARNFNPLAAMCGRVTIAEVEHLVEPGEIGADDVHTPGVFVQRVVALTAEQVADKKIEKRTVRPAPRARRGTWMPAGRVRRWPRGPPRSWRTAPTSTSGSGCRRWCRTTSTRTSSWCCSRRTASSASGPTPSRATRTPT